MPGVLHVGDVDDSVVETLGVIVGDRVVVGAVSDVDVGDGDGEDVAVGVGDGEGVGVGVGVQFHVVDAGLTVSDCLEEVPVNVMVIVEQVVDDIVT